MALRFFEGVPETLQTLRTGTGYNYSQLSGMRTGRGTALPNFRGRGRGSKHLQPISGERGLIIDPRKSSNVFLKSSIYPNSSYLCDCVTNAQVK